MKKTCFALWGTVLLLAVCTTAQSQFLFSVRPQLLGLNGAAFGYQFPGNIAAFGGVDHMGIGATVESSTTLSISGYPPQSSSDKAEASLSLYNLFLGSKCFVITSGSAKGYVLGEISRPIVRFSVKSNGIEDATLKQLSDNLSIWGIKAGVGGEYFFSEDFSLGGEFGIRFFFVSTGTEQTQTGQYYGTYTYTARSKTDIDLDISLTYGLLTLNYYFH
jgi:hypothetical protein